MKSLRLAQDQAFQISTQTLNSMFTVSLTSLCFLHVLYFKLWYCFLWHHFLSYCSPPFTLPVGNTKEQWGSPKANRKGSESVWLLNSWDRLNLKAQKSSVNKVKTTDQIQEMLWLFHSRPLRWHQGDGTRPPEDACCFVRNGRIYEVWHSPTWMLVEERVGKRTGDGQRGCMTITLLRRREMAALESIRGFAQRLACELPLRWLQRMRTGSSL